MGKRKWSERFRTMGIIIKIIYGILAILIIMQIRGLIIGRPIIVAIVSESMNHQGSFDDWWLSNTRCKPSQEKIHYDSPYRISRQRFETFPYHNGLKKGDLVILQNPKYISRGDVIIFNVEDKGIIIHRVVVVKGNAYTTKGDWNCGPQPFEQDIKREDIIGKAVFKVPYAGWIKIGVNSVLRKIGANI